MKPSSQTLPLLRKMLPLACWCPLLVALPLIIGTPAERQRDGAEGASRPRAVEFRSYNLAPGTRPAFHRVVVEQAAPMLSKWGIDVVAFGPSPHDADSYFLIRAFDDLQARERSEADFYGSEEWRSGPREQILALIESYSTFVLLLDDATIAGLRTAGAAIPETRQTPAPQHAVRSSFGLAVPHPPATTTLDGRTHLVYELHLTNFARVDLTLTRIDVLDPEHPEAPRAELEGEALERILGGPGVASADADRTRVPPGRRVVAYLWLPLDRAAATPSRISHRIEYRQSQTPDVAVAGGTAPGLTVEGGSTPLDGRAPAELGPPLTGGPWVAVYDPTLARGHQRVLLALDGRARIPARFAVDWFLLDEDGRTTQGDRERVTNWYGYGADVLAVADATVVAARGSMAESPTLQTEFDPDLDRGSGNYVSLDLGDGRYVHYEHLKPGSVTVAIGDRVRRGGVVAQAGYTGHSTGPHLHMHVSDRAAPLAGEGVPWVLSDFHLLGSYGTQDPLASFIEGSRWNPVAAGASARRSLEAPAPFAVVEFPATGR